MGRIGSRPRWQTVAFIVVFTGVIMGLIYAFRDHLLIQGLVFGILSAGLSVTALREGTRRGKLSRLFMGPFVFSTFLATVAEIGVALIPAVAFWILTIYYGFSDMMSEDPLGVHDDRTRNP